MKRRTAAPDERQLMIERFRTWFEVPHRDWLPAGGAFTADGRDLVFQPVHDPGGRLMSVLRKARQNGKSTGWLTVYVPDQPDRGRMAPLTAGLAGGYTLVAHPKGVMAFQLVAFDQHQGDEVDDLLVLPHGRCFQVWRPTLSAWDGTALIAVPSAARSRGRLTPDGVDTDDPVFDLSGLAFD